ncbi:MAG TPA: hypothetical protein VGO80_10355 [Solirubrobacteraceae bacterium]|nr:hypothetical protein [Solirubrobacteraceae bacterium]
MLDDLAQLLLEQVGAVTFHRPMPFNLGPVELIIVLGILVVIGMLVRAVLR